MSASTDSNTDALTGLATRDGFMPLADKSLKLCARLGEPATLLLLELAQGLDDSALRAFADLLNHVFRDSDVIARLDDRRFAVLLTADDHHDVNRALERLQQACEQEASQLSYAVAAVTRPAPSDESLAELLERARDGLADKA